MLVSHQVNNVKFSEIRFIFQWVEKLPVVQLRHETLRHDVGNERNFSYKTNIIQVF